MTGPARGRDASLASQVLDDDIDSSSVMLFPNPSSVAGRVLSDLLGGREITHYDCWIEHGAARLAHQIYTLRSCGWPVTTIRRRVTTSDGNRTTTIAFYSFSEEVLQEIGPMARFLFASLRAGKEGAL